jgi:hypothetical protein
MPATSAEKPDYQNIFHWAETQQDGAVPSFALRKNDPYQVTRHQPEILEDFQFNNV